MMRLALIQQNEAGEQTTLAEFDLPIPQPGQNICCAPQLKPDLRRGNNFNARAVTVLKVDSAKYDSSSNPLKPGDTFTSIRAFSERIGASYQTVALAIGNEKRRLQKLTGEEAGVQPVACVRGVTFCYSDSMPPTSGPFAVPL